MSKISLPLFSLVLFTWIPSISFALPNQTDTENVSAEQTDKQDSGAVSLLETVLVTANRSDTQLKDIAASISAVSNDELENIQHVHINEALARIAGTWISRGNGQENLTAIRSPVLTGAGSCGAFQFSMDNIPLRAAGLCNVNQLFEANSEQANSIEVIRGPSSVLYGANAIHGSINVISGNKLNTLFNQQNNDSTTFSDKNMSIDLGPHGYSRIKSSTAFVSENQGVQININGTRDDGYKDDSGLDQQKMDVIHQYRGDTVNISSALNMSNLNQETAGYIQGPDAYKDSALKTINDNPEAFRDAASIRLHSRIEWTKNQSNWSLTPYVRKTEMDFLMHFLPGQPLEENGQKSIGIQLNHRYFGFNQLEVFSGLELERSTGFLKQTQASPVNGSSDFLNATLPAGKQYDFDVNVTMLSPFSQITYSIDDVNQLSLGIRAEILEYDYTNKMLTGNTAEDGTACGFGGCRYSRPDSRSDSFNNLSTKLGWIHDINNQSQGFINISQAFRAPQATELYRLQNDQLVADLKSEKINSLELGYRASFDSTSYTLAAYYMEKENVIFQNSDRENISNGATRHSGLELTSKTNIAKDLTLSLTGSYGDHRYTDNIAPRGVSENIDGNQIDTAPKLTGNTQLNWIINPSQNLELEWVHLGPYYTDEVNQNEYEGHDLFNLRYSYQVADQWRVSARITNLLDSDYAERADYGFGNERYFVGEPASLYVSLAAKF